MMDDTWAALAPYYDLIFPPGKPQLDFVSQVLGRLHHPAGRLLDVGCGTGGHALALAGAGLNVTGVDLSRAMVSRAHAKARAWETDPTRRAGAGRHAPVPRFILGDMTDLEGLPPDPSRPYDAVICLGNTLASLLSAAELGAALGEMARVVRVDGRAILQTVNYDRPEAAGETSFPPIRLPGPENLVFERRNVPRPDGLVDFLTTLRAAGGAEVASARSVLRRTHRDELEAVARMAFHGGVEVYGDFLFSAWSTASPATVLVVERGPD